MISYFCCKKHLDIQKHNHHHSAHWLNCKKRYICNFHCNDYYNLYQTIHFHSLYSEMKTNCISEYVNILIAFSYVR